MVSIDLLCPCSSTDNSDELKVEQDTTLIVIKVLEWL